MISKVECVMLECDNCKETYESHVGYSIFVDYEAVVESADDDGWEMHHESRNHYCDKCHFYNDNDEFVINSERTIKTNLIYKMKDLTQETGLLIKSVHEIKSLRSENKIMSARLQMFDDMMLLFRSNPNFPSQGMSPDLVWEIEKFINDNQNDVK